MTLRELLESGIVFEGWRKVQCWENEDNPTIYCEGYFIDKIPEKYMSRKVNFMCAYERNGNKVGLCIEVDKSEPREDFVAESLETFSVEQNSGYEAFFERNKEYNGYLENDICYVTDANGKDIPFDIEEFRDIFILVLGKRK